MRKRQELQWSFWKNLDFKYTATEKIPTYALTADSATAASFTDLYICDGSTNASLKKQISLQTDAGATAAVKNLISVNSPETAIYTKSPTGEVKQFQIKKNTIIRLRMYVWLEGQDVDTTNYASHGGGITVNIGLVKSFTDTSLLGNTSSGSANNKGNT